jgi:hypothetical protein
MDYLTYEHRQGYSRVDHMADEVIARAVRRLGGDTAGVIAQHVGLASHSVPMGRIEVRLPWSAATKRAMVRALREARGEFASRPDCVIIVCRYRRRRLRGTSTVVTERWRGGREWVEVDAA